MKLETLKNSVAHLGFESDLNDIDNEITEKAFFAALNKAVYTVNELRPRTSVYTIEHKTLQIAAKSALLIHRGEDIVISVPSAMSYVFRTTGSGNFIITASDSETPLVEKAWTEPQTFRGYFGRHSDVTVTFSGDFVYSVYAFALYNEAYSAQESDVPDCADWTTYDLSSLTEDFHSLQGYKIESSGKTLINSKDYKIQDGSKILLPQEGADGLYEVTYRRKLRQYTVDDNENAATIDIDLDDDLALLLPNLVAYYVLLDDEPVKAATYYNIYLSEYAEKVQRMRRTDVPPVSRICDWG